jgi:hypothetical protein
MDIFGYLAALKNVGGCQRRAVWWTVIGNAQLILWISRSWRKAAVKVQKKNVWKQ